MAGFKLTAFAGIVPRSGPTLLKDNEAQKASNTKLYSGELRSWNSPGSLTPNVLVAEATKAIYLHKKSTGEDLWLSWSSDVNVAPGPIYALDENPIYYTGDGTPKKTNSSLAQTGSGPYPGSYLAMGVPAPVAAPTVTVSGGSGTAESRVYLYTYISMFGTIEEESAPSPASAIVNVLPGSTVTISGLPAAAPVGLYNITKVRIYRAVTGSASTVYLKVKDVAIGTTSTTDAVAASGLGGILDSYNNDAPPSDMQGLCSMANGILAGFRGNEVYFCKAYLPHAWPAEYAMTVEYPIVGIAAFGSSLLVATKGNPFIISGSTPGSMSQEKLPLYEPCASKRSMATDESGALYVSPNGVVRVGPGFYGVSTVPLFTRDEWQQYTLATTLGAVLGGRYYLFCERPSTGFNGALIFDKNESASPLTEISLTSQAVFVSPVTASLYIVDGTEIKEWQGAQYEYLPYEWKSKLFILQRPTNFGAGQIEADFQDIALAEAQQQQLDATIAANIALFNSTSDLQSTPGMTPPVGQGLIAGSVLTALPDIEIDNRYVTLTVYANGKQVSQQNIKSADPFRLPSGFKADRWEFKLNGNIPIRHLKVAETSKGLVDL